MKGFTIAGADKNFVPASAGIEDDKVVANADPVSVRYNGPMPAKSNYFTKTGSQLRRLFRARHVCSPEAGCTLGALQLRWWSLLFCSTPPRRCVKGLFFKRRGR